MRVLPSSGLAFLEISRLIPLMPRLDVCAPGTHQEGLWHAEQRTNRAPSAQNRSHHLNGHSDGEQTRGSRVGCCNVRWTILSRTGRHRNRDVNPSLAWEIHCGANGPANRAAGRHRGTGRLPDGLLRGFGSALPARPSGATGARTGRGVVERVGQEDAIAEMAAFDRAISGNETSVAGRRPALGRNVSRDAREVREVSASAARSV